MKRNKRGIKGSFTVEAAYILPMVCFLIWNILYLSFFIYNQSAVLQGSYVSALRAERLVGTEKEKKQILEEKYEREVTQKIVCGSIQAEKIIKKEEVIVETKMKMKVPRGLFFKNGWEGDTRQGVEKYSPASFIRACRKAENILSFITDGG